MIATRVRRLAGAPALALVLLAGSPPASAATPDAWAGAHADAGNTATNPGEAVITAGTAGQVTTAWTSTQRSATPDAPVVLDGVAYHVTTAGNVTAPGTFTATSAQTGATLWTLPLPGNAQYRHGLSATGGLVVVPFDGYRRAGGVLVVDLATRAVAWSADLPPSAISWMDDTQSGPAVTDGSRVYLPGSSNAVNAYRLGDGALLWTAPLVLDAQGVPARVDGLAAGGTSVYTGGAGGVVAYDAATGGRLWSGPASGVPVVAGDRVFGAGSGSVVALPAGGCGAPSCAPLWTSALAPDATATSVAAADADTVFVTYQQGSSGGAGPVGVVARLSAATGQVQWAAPAGRYATGLVRAGSTVWLLDEHVGADGVVADRILAFATTATDATPLREIDLPQSYWGFPQSLAVAAGTLFEQTWGRGYLIGYRVPGS